MNPIFPDMRIDGDKVILDYKKFLSLNTLEEFEELQDEIMDILDIPIIEARRNQPMIPWEEVKARLNKKHGITDASKEG